VRYRPGKMRKVVLLALALLYAGSAHADLLIDIGGRTVNVHVPPSYSAGTPMPVVFLLHGYTSSGAAQESYMQFEPLADSLGFLYLHPDGTLNCLDPSERFWNATDACCNFCESTVDDAGFLASVLDEVEAAFTVDTRRVYLIGHSNGGFMSYRMACENADRITAVASLAGATWSDPLDCTPAEPVHVLQIHGDNDATILYAGDEIVGVPYPGAVATTETWATYNGCSLTPDLSAPNFDLDSGIPGDETTVARYDTGCAEGGSAELWTIVGGGHVPSLSADFSDEVIAHLLARTKPAGPPAAVVPVVPALAFPYALAAVVFVTGARAARRWARSSRGA
jgi:polyhydroxybutyrate depolymerase